MRTKIIAALMLGSLGLFSSAAVAETIRLQGNYNRSELRSACESNGGTYFGNLNGHHCVKSCTSSSGQQGTCSVDCSPQGNCTGTTPGRTVQNSPLNLDRLLGSGGGGMTLSR